MARKKRHEAHGNHERWLVSYADFITLLFAFFVTMYSISRVDGKKFGSAVDSIHRALGSVVPLNMPLGAPGFFGEEKDAVSPQMAKEMEERRMVLERLLHEAEARGGLREIMRGLRVTIDERGLVVSFPDVALFEPRSADILPDVRPLLDDLGDALLKMNSPIRVEGHTDNTACSPKWPSNWELSTARAGSVVRFLASHTGFNPARLSAAGYASYRPVDTNDTEIGRAHNRRVDIVVLDTKARAQEPSGLKPPLPITTQERK